MEEYSWKHREESHVMYIKKFIKNINGLTLTEILMAICIMTITVMTITGMFIAGMISMKKGDNVIVATNLAQSTLELAKHEILNNFNVYDEMHSPYPVTTTEIEGVIYNGRMFIKDIPSPSSPKIKYVEVSIYWNEKNIEGKRGKPLEMKFSTYIKNPD